VKNLSTVSGIDYEKICNPVVTPTDLQRVSPCPLASIPNRYLNFRSRSEQFKTREQISGIFFHKLIEMARAYVNLDKRVGVYKLRKYYFDLLEEFSASFGSSLDHIPLPIQKWNALADGLSTAEKILLEPINPATSVENEITLCSAVPRLQGIIDEIQIASDRILIRDYKLAYKSNALLKPRFVDQLHFYSILVSKIYPGLELRMELVGLLGAKIFVPVDQDRVKAVETKALGLFDSMRGIGANRTPVDEICSGCDFCTPHSLSDEDD
jgi:hypothetical protein